MEGPFVFFVTLCSESFGYRQGGFLLALVEGFWQKLGVTPPTIGGSLQSKRITKKMHFLAPLLVRFS
jgi:hypothetical protein